MPRFLLVVVLTCSTATANQSDGPLLLDPSGQTLETTPPSQPQAEAGSTETEADEPLVEELPIPPAPTPAPQRATEAGSQTPRASSATSRRHNVRRPVDIDPRYREIDGQW